jgi:D-xylose transport system substrate-binding protein
MDAKSSATEQSAQIDKAVDDGIDALIVLAQDPDGIKPSVERALAHGVPVIALHRAITNPNVLFVGPDEVRMGELAAQAVLAVKPSGRFVVIKGDESQIRSGLLRQGMTRAGLPDVGKSSDTLVNVGETYTPFWDPNTAKTEMDDFLRRNADKVDIAFAEQDGLTDGVMAALDERHLAGKVLVAGIGGELPETALHRIALGLQTVEVVTDPSVEGRVAGEAALALCADHRVGDVTTSGGKPAPLSADGSVTVPAILVPPIAFDRTNLRVALAKHFGTADYVCKDVKPGTVDGC